MVANDGKQRLDAAPLEHGVRQAFVNRERALELLELLVREVADGRLGDRDEGNLVRDAHDREAELVGLGEGAGGVSAKPNPRPNPRPARRCSASRRT